MCVTISVHAKTAITSANAMHALSQVRKALMSLQKCRF